MKTFTQPHPTKTVVVRRKEIEGGGTREVPVYRQRWADSQKNIDYIMKRRALAAAATQELGVQCWG